jgi:hypothetical protein
VAFFSPEPVAKYLSSLLISHDRTEEFSWNCEGEVLEMNQETLLDWGTTIEVKGQLVKYMFRDLPS